MALIKCSECGQEISTEATVCPHCGNPNIPTDERETRSSIWHSLLFLCIIILAAGGIYYFQYPNEFSGIPSVQQLVSDINPQIIAPIKSGIAGTPNANTSNTVTLQQVNDVGYSFYVAQIEAANAPPISDDEKNQLAQVFYTDNFPNSLLKSLGIIIVNTVAVTPNIVIATPIGKLPSWNPDPNFLAAGGEFGTYTTPSGIMVPFTLIFLNKNLFGSGQLEEVLTHELGHDVGNTLTDLDWQTYYQLRGIPADTSRNVPDSATSPNEDFAEVYENVVAGIRMNVSVYGLLEPAMGPDYAGGLTEITCGPIYTQAYNSDLQQYQSSNTCSPSASNYPMCLYGFNVPTASQSSAAETQANADPAVQACRRKVMLNPSEYSNDYEFGTPYTSTVGPETKAFIKTILARFN